MAAKKKQAAKKAAAKPKAGKKPAAKSKKKNPTRKDVSDNASSMGHNIEAIRKDSVPAMKALMALQERMESDMGGYRSEFADLYEKHAKAIGCKESVLKAEFRLMLANKRRIEAEAELAQAERDQIEALRASFEGTLFENFAGGELAAMATPSNKSEPEKLPAGGEEEAEEDNVVDFPENAA